MDSEGKVSICRELYGRGLIGSLKASTWYQQLQEKQGQGKQHHKVKVKNAVRVQVCMMQLFTDDRAFQRFSWLLSTSEVIPVGRAWDVQKST